MKKKILLVGATTPEILDIATQLAMPSPKQGDWTSTQWQEKEVYLLCTGIGLVNTAIQLTRFFGQVNVDHAIQFGIGGSFSTGPALETVVEITRDCYGDLGAEAPGGFLDLEEMGFQNFQAGELSYYNQMDNPFAGATGLPTCSAISVNRVHGTSDTVAAAEQKWDAQVESMEGAAFFQVCLANGVPFTQLRGISNRVEERNKSSWKIKAAISEVQKATLDFLDAL